MKKIFLLVSFCTLLCSCPNKDNIDLFKYSIANNSGQNVTLFTYVDGQRDLSSKVELKQGQNLTKEKEDVPPYKGFSMWALFEKQTTGNTTGIEIIYNNTKKTIFLRCPDLNCVNEPRNIFDIKFNDELTEVYTITPQDFQNATDCGGNCF